MDDHQNGYILNNFYKISKLVLKTVVSQDLLLERRLWHNLFMIMTWHPAFIHCRLCTVRKVNRPQEDIVCPSIWLSVSFPMPGSFPELEARLKFSLPDQSSCLQESHLCFKHTCPGRHFYMDAECLNWHPHVGTGSILTHRTSSLSDNYLTVSIVLTLHYCYNEGFLKQRMSQVADLEKPVSFL